MSDIQFAIGMSKEWDPYGAGHEATYKAISQIKEQPKFLLIFCTIHYDKKKGGLKRLLSGSKDVVGDGVPSIGGTITGFICPEGCFMRGVIVIAGFGDINCLPVFGSDVIYKAEYLGEKIGIKIRDWHLKSEKKNKLVFAFSSGPIEPPLMALSSTHKLLDKIYEILPHNIAWKVRDLSLKAYISFLPSGPGQEETFLSSLEKNIPHHYLVGCSTFDNMKSLKNYQFFNNEVLHNSVVALSLETNKNILLECAIPVISTGKKFKIKRGWNNFMVDLIDNKPAVKEYIDQMGWPEEYIQDKIEGVTKVTFYYPMGYKQDNQLYMFTMGFFYGQSVVTNRRILSNDVELYMTSSRLTLESFKEYLDKTKSVDKEFTFITEHMNVIGILGNKLYTLKNLLDRYLGLSKYVLLFGVGEYSKKPDEKTIFNDYSITFMSIVN